MITENSFTIDWYDRINWEYKNLDRNLVDKVTHAFYLLEKISDTRLNFIFKGGTCLLLLMKEMKRFSIDIDIIITEKISKEILSNSLQEIVDQSIFTHFIDTLPPNKVVTAPDIENILGDKLSAFAPNTTGIPYGRGKEMEIIKQLFDIESLFDQAEDLNKIKETFIKCTEQELIYRQLTHLSSRDVFRRYFKNCMYYRRKRKYTKRNLPTAGRWYTKNEISYHQSKLHCRRSGPKCCKSFLLS